MPASARSLKPDAMNSAQVAAGLRDLGLSSGDTVLVHASLRSFAGTVSGPNVIVDALLAVVGERGCVVLPTLTLGGDEARLVFDVRRSPSTSGAVSEAFRLRPDAKRSLHPTSSASAIGWASRELTAHHDDTPCGLTSPYGQVYLRGGFCLFLGAPWGSNSMFHVAEEIAMPPYLRFAEFRDARVIDDQGREYCRTFRRYNCSQTGIVRDVAAAGQHYVAGGVVRSAAIGPSACRLVAACDIVRITADLLTLRPEEVVSDGH